jgi:hypothetical protein
VPMCRERPSMYRSVPTWLGHRGGARARQRRIRYHIRDWSEKYRNATLLIVGKSLPGAPSRWIRDFFPQTPVHPHLAMPRWSVAPRGAVRVRRRSSRGVPTSVEMTRIGTLLIVGKSFPAAPSLCQARGDARATKGEPFTPASAPSESVGMLLQVPAGVSRQPCAPSSAVAAALDNFYFFSNCAPS